MPALEEDLAISTQKSGFDIKQVTDIATVEQIFDFYEREYKAYKVGKNPVLHLYSANGIPITPQRFTKVMGIYAYGLDEWNKKAALLTIAKPGETFSGWGEVYPRQENIQRSNRINYEVSYYIGHETRKQRMGLALSKVLMGMAFSRFGADVISTEIWNENIASQGMLNKAAIESDYQVYTRKGIDMTEFRIFSPGPHLVEP